MTTTPNWSIGTISQRSWRGVGTGPLDDCWACADALCIHGAAPHLGLVSVTAYRAAAGVPDTNTGAEGGSLEASLKAIKALWPALGALVTLYRGSFAAFDAQILAGHSASCSVYSATLTGTAVRHRIAVRSKDGQRQYVNPLDPAYTFPKDVTQATLKKWCVDYPDAAEVNALIFPTVEEAFKTHPLYVAPADATEQQLAAARAVGFADGKAKAAAAVQSITL